ncbi:MAG: AAA family ATPase [Firmicutes bacterium]|nr:AAA family ATPase [Bacillota bacterium]
MIRERTIEVLSEFINLDNDRYEIKWNNLDIPEFQKLMNLGYHSEWHREGDTYRHVQLVVDECQKGYDSKDFSNADRMILSAAALFHDIGKGVTSQLKEDGNWSAPYHAVEGEKITRFLLWDEHISIREAICMLVRYHMKPKYFPLNTVKENIKTIFEISLNSDCVLLNHLNFSDILGADSIHKEEELKKSEIFKDYAKHIGCFRNHSGEIFPRPRYFVGNVYDQINGIKDTLEWKRYSQEISNHYHFKSEEFYDIFNEMFETPKKRSKYDFDIVIMCGVVGAGKTTAYEEKYKPLGYELVSRDIIRQELGMVDANRKFKGKKGQEDKVTHIEHKRIKELCEKKQPFVSDNIYLQRKFRTEFINMVTPYNPYITIEYHETLKQNHIERRKGQVHENSVIKMMKNMEFPLPSEAHEVRYYRDGIDEYNFNTK